MWVSLNYYIDYSEAAFSAVLSNREVATLLAYSWLVMGLYLADGMRYGIYSVSLLSYAM